MRKTLTQQRTVIEGWPECGSRADILEPGRYTRQILPVRQTKIINAHQRRHDRYIRERDLPAEQPGAAAAFNFLTHSFVGATQTRESSIHLVLGKTRLSHRKHKFTAQRFAFRHRHKSFAA